jgi:hypothetical protein
VGRREAAGGGTGLERTHTQLRVLVRPLTRARSPRRVGAVSCRGPTYLVLGHPLPLDAEALASLPLVQAAAGRCGTARKEALCGRRPSSGRAGRRR